MDEERFGVAKELGELSAKVDLMIANMTALQQSLQTHYTQKSETEDIKRRVTQLESAPTRWIPIIVAGAALLLQFLRP